VKTLYFGIESSRGR